MKRSVFSMRSLSGAMLTALLGMLGFSSCHTQKAPKETPVEINPDQPRIIAMYGTPTSRYTVKEVTFDSTAVDSVATDITPRNSIR